MGVRPEVGKEAYDGEKELERRGSGWDCKAGPVKNETTKLTSPATLGPGEEMPAVLGCWVGPPGSWVQSGKAALTLEESSQRCADLIRAGHFGCK